MLTHSYNFSTILSGISVIWIPITIESFSCSITFGSNIPYSFCTYACLISDVLNGTENFE